MNRHDQRAMQAFINLQEKDDPMPQADDTTRALMKKWFDDEVDQSGPYNFLMEHGWKDLKGVLVPPVESHTPSIPELHCAWFLCDEWDFGYNGRYGIDPKQNL